jgi:isopenicillin-N epimerase
LLGSLATLPLPEKLQRVPASGKIDREQLRLYDEFRIEVPLMRFGTPERRWFRISAQLYNAPAEYEYLAAALLALAAESG